MTPDLCRPQPAVQAPACTPALAPDCDPPICNGTNAANPSSMKSGEAFIAASLCLLGACTGSPGTRVAYGPPEPGGWDGNGRHWNPMEYQPTLGTPEFAPEGTGPSTFANYQSIGFRVADVEVEGCEVPDDNPDVTFIGSRNEEGDLWGPSVLVDGERLSNRDAVTFGAELVDGDGRVGPAVITLQRVNTVKHPRSPNLKWPSYAITFCTADLPEATYGGVINLFPTMALVDGRMQRVPGVVSALMTYYATQPRALALKAAINTHAGVDLAREGHVMLTCNGGGSIATRDLLIPLALAIGDAAVVHWPGSDEEILAFMTEDKTSVKVGALLQGDSICHPSDFQPSGTGVAVEALGTMGLGAVDAIYADWTVTPADVLPYASAHHLAVGTSRSRIDAYLSAVANEHAQDFVDERDARGGDVVIGDHTGAFPDGSSALQYAAGFADLVMAASPISTGPIGPTAPFTGSVSIEDEILAACNVPTPGDDFCCPAEIGTDDCPVGDPGAVAM